MLVISRKIMKKRFLIIIIFICFLSIKAYSLSYKSSHYDFCAYFNGKWTEWHSRENGLGIAGWQVTMIRNYNRFGGIAFNIVSFEKIEGTPFQFHIDNFTPPTKKEIKQHIKNNEWYVYEGWVEYYVNDDYPTIKDMLIAYHFPVVYPDKKKKNSSICVMRKAKATIKIAPYKEKEYPKLINIFFDNVGIGVEVDLSWTSHSFFISK